MSLGWEPLHRERFAPFGDVIEVGGGKPIPINDGTTVRYDDLAAIDIAGEGGRPVVSIFDSRPFGFPLEVRTLERHPLSSQAFVPLNHHPFVVVVAPAGESVRRADVRAFVTNGAQGVNYRRGVWHHACIVTVHMRFLVIDRGIAEPNCDFFTLPAGEPPLVLAAPRSA